MNAPCDDGGAAFPQHGWSKDPEVRKHMAEAGLGMTLRDYFAGQALNACVLTIVAAHPENEIAEYQVGIAAEAYRIADAMLKERSA